MLLLLEPGAHAAVSALTGAPVEYLPKNQLVFFLLDLADELDLEAIHSDSTTTTMP